MKAVYNSRVVFFGNTHSQIVYDVYDPLGRMTDKEIEGQTVFAVVVTQGNEDTLHYILKDNLGSWTTITDSEGNVEQELSFDAWGNRRNPNIWQNYTVAEPVEAPMFDRGFTGHEHLYAFGLINMNGRMYDPQMSSFLSVDAYVQSPDNSQSFNRYAYCLNNPLKYTDPSGWQMVGGTTPSNPFHENWGVNLAEHVVTSHEARQILWDMGISIGTWMMGNVLTGSGGGGESSCEGGDDVYCQFGIRNPNSVGVEGQGACVFASMGLICKRQKCWRMDPKYWKAKEEEYYKMKNGDGEENESNHGYLNINLVEFIQWVGKQENITIIVQPILLKDIPKVDNSNGEVLVIVGLDNTSLIEKNHGQTGHAAVVNTFLWRKDDSVEMTFGDPSPQRIMPVKYIDNNSRGWRPDGFSAWIFYGINITKP